MIKNVVFDLGRVIYTYDPLGDLLNEGLSKEAAGLFMSRIYDSKMWQEIDRGVTSIAEYLDKWIAEFPDMAEDLRLIFRKDWVDRVLKVMPDSLEFFYEVKQRGFKIYILTNFAKDSFSFVSTRDTFFKDADGIVVSAYEKLIKPDHAIYHCLINRYNLVPEETIFIDDMPQNVAAAKEVGIHSIQFTGLEDVKRRFNEIAAS